MKKGARIGAVGGMVVGALGLPLAVATMASVALDAPASSAVGPGARSGPSEVAGIPPAYLVASVRAGQRFDVPWAVIAAIYRQECDFGQSTLAGCDPPGSENGAGAQGPGQFLPPTWRRGLGPHDRILPGPPTVSNDDGYATDGDGDGSADPWNVFDATASTARLLAANGAPQDLERAVMAYNHDPRYVATVLALSDSYEQVASMTSPSQPSGSATVGGGTAPELESPGEPDARVVVAVDFAAEHLGDPYEWGGDGPDAWDCSGLVQAALDRAGVLLPRVAQSQFDATKSAEVATGTPLEAGDLVFFGPSRTSIDHVGIVVGGGQMIDAPHTGGVVRVESYAWADLVAATRPLS